jgi:hypothetical protein
MEAPKRALSGGEVDPDLWHASDLNPVRIGAAEVRNFIVRQRGGVERRPGTELLALAKTAARVRLVPFSRSSDASYLLEFGPSYVRAYDADMAAGDAMTDEAATPYLAADLAYLQWAQSNDVQWVFSGGPVKELQRDPAGPSFDLVDAQIDNGPFLDLNPDKTLTLKASAVTGAGVTLTASAALFQAGHVGSVWRLEEGDTGIADLWLPGKAVALNVEKRFNGRTYRCAVAGTTTSYPPEHESGTRDDGEAVEWEYLHSGFGIVKITGYTSPTSVTATVLKRLPQQVVTLTTWRWQEGAFSSLRGYPITGALYKNALWMGGTAAEPYRLWKSAIDGFNDFEPGVFDDSALTRDLVDGATEAVRWMAPSKALVIGTDGPEWLARPDSEGDTVRINNLLTEPATNEGSSEIPGLTIGSRTVFTDAGRRRLVSISYDIRQSAWLPAELSLLSAHILGAGVLEVVYQRNPWPIIWCLLEDGTLAALTYLPEQDVLAWHRHDFGDPVESIAVLKVEGGRREALFLAVRRDGAVCLERMFDRHRPETGQGIAEARYLQSAKVYTLGAPETVFTGLDHLEGREVIALVDGNSHPPVTVTGGSVTLNFAGSNVVIGLSYKSRYQTLPFDMGMPDLAQTPKNKRATDLAIAFRASMGGLVEVGGKVQDVFRLGASPLDAAPELFDGVKTVFPPGADNAGQLAYENETAWPATLTAIFPEYED